MKHKIPCTALEIAPDVILYHTGPDLDQGPLPSIFYFALSGFESLTLDPFNQPVQALLHRRIRFFSMTLPNHEKGSSPTHALTLWAQDMSKGIDCLGDFFERALRAIDYAIQGQLADPDKLGIAGLSRGGFIASHLAAREERFHAMLQFAPITNLSHAKEFHSLHDYPIVRSLDLFPLASKLANRPTRFYIGNRDTRVSTHACAEFALHLAEHSTNRSPPIELIITPSIGQMGHGTSPEIFHQGAEWLANVLEK